MKYVAHDDRIKDNGHNATYKNPGNDLDGHFDDV